MIHLCKRKDNDYEGKKKKKDILNTEVAVYSIPARPSNHRPAPISSKAKNDDSPQIDSGKLPNEIPIIDISHLPVDFI